MEKAVSAAAGQLGPIHGLVACSGLGGANDGDRASDRFDDLVATNLNGTYYCCRAALEHLAPGPDPPASSRRPLLDPRPDPGARLHGVQRIEGRAAGPRAVVRGRARRRDVEINAICPGWVDTDMAWSGLDGIAAAAGGTREEAYREAMRSVPLGRMSQPDDIAGTVAWLLSPDARGVTGQAIDQNGGAWMG